MNCFDKISITFRDADIMFYLRKQLRLFLTQLGKGNKVIGLKTGITPLQLQLNNGKRRQTGRNAAREHQHNKGGLNPCFKNSA